MDESPLIQLAYVSTQTQQFSSRDLIELLSKARAFNLKHEITGLLLHKGDSFFQIIEGPEREVAATFQRVCADKRHHLIDTLLKEPIGERRYADWQMGFLNLDNVDMSLLKGYSPYLEGDDPRVFLTSIGKGERLAMLFKALN